VPEQRKRTGEQGAREGGRQIPALPQGTDMEGTLERAAERLSDRSASAADAGGVGHPMLSRRGLIGGSAALAGLAWTGGGTLAGAPVRMVGDARPGGSRARSRYAVETRIAAARLQEREPVPHHATNGDETAHPRWSACYSKGLPHNALGEVDDAAYRLLLAALASGEPAEFERIPLGG
jgi:hypothetical protein